MCKTTWYLHRCENSHSKKDEENEGENISNHFDHHQPSKVWFNIGSFMNLSNNSKCAQPVEKETI